jgi:hypothetical protein
MFFSRGRNKIQDLAKMQDLYEVYTYNHEGNDLYDISYKMYRDVLVDYYKAIMNEVLNGYRYKMPSRLGYLYVTKRLVNVRSLTKHGIDWVESVKNKKVIYHLNTHSKNFIYRFKWHKENSVIPNLYYYKFVASRANKRELAKIIKNRQCDYFEK